MDCGGVWYDDGSDKHCSRGARRRAAGADRMRTASQQVSIATFIFFAGSGPIWDPRGPVLRADLFATFIVGIVCSCWFGLLRESFFDNPLELALKMLELMFELEFPALE